MAMGSLKQGIKSVKDAPRRIEETAKGPETIGGG